MHDGSGISIVGPWLDTERLQNLLGLVFVDLDKPPALVVLVDRVAAEWGPSLSAPASERLNEVRDTWLDAVLAQLQRGRHLLGVVWRFADGEREVEWWKDAIRERQVPEAWALGAVAQAIADLHSKAASANSAGVPLEGRIIEWRDERASEKLPNPPPDEPWDPWAVHWTELAQALGGRMAEGAEPWGVIVLMPEAEVGQKPCLRVIDLKVLNRGVAGYHEAAMMDGFDVFGRCRDRMFHLAKSGNILLAVLVRMPQGKWALLYSHTAMAGYRVPVKAVETGAAEWLMRQGLSAA